MHGVAAPVLSCDALGLTLPNDRWLFRSWDLQLFAGESVRIHGPSGVGKSQLLRCLAGLRPCNEGVLRLEGRSYESTPPSVWRRNLRLVTARTGALDATPADWWNSLCMWSLAPSPPGRAPEYWVERWGLSRDALQRPFAHLSQGEAQRCVLALALATEPTVLLLDEATTGLDPEALHQVEADLAGRSALWVTHDSAQAERVCTRTVPLRAAGANS